MPGTRRVAGAAAARKVVRQQALMLPGRTFKNQGRTGPNVPQGGGMVEVCRYIREKCQLQQWDCGGGKGVWHKGRLAGWYSRQQAHTGKGPKTPNPRHNETPKKQSGTMKSTENYPFNNGIGLDGVAHNVQNVSEGAQACDMLYNDPITQAAASNVSSTNAAQQTQTNHRCKKQCGKGEQ